jgi:preprotein translocase subunit SecG
VLMPLGVLSQYIFGSLLFILSFLIVAIILLQRGRGGGLTGALGGLGGQSAFGVKAGDIFTRITAVLVLLWITVCALAAFWYKEQGPDFEADISTRSSSSTGGMGASDRPMDPFTDETGIPGLPSIPPGTEPGTPGNGSTETPPAPAEVPPATEPSPPAAATSEPSATPAPAETPK